MSGSDNVGLSRLIINRNFSAIKAVVDALTDLLNPDTLSLSGIKSLTVENTAVTLSDSILNIGKGATILGDVKIGTPGSSLSGLTLRGTAGMNITEGSLTVTLGNVTLDAVTSLLNAKGHVSFGKEIRMPGISSAFSSYVGLTNTSSVTAVSPAGMKYLVISNIGSTESVAMSLDPGTTGQVVEIYHALGTAGGPVSIDVSSGWAGVTGSIEFTETGDKIKCVYESSSWYLWDFTPNSAMSGSSLTFTRV